MSEYWEAVRRAALGLPGLADPRPRSMFESDGAPDVTEGGEAVEDEDGALPTRHAPAPPAMTPASPPLSPPTPKPSLTPPPTQSASATGERPEIRVEALAALQSPDVSPPPPPDRVTPWPLGPAVHAVTHFEVRQINTTRTILEPGPRPPAVEPDGTASTPVRTEPTPRRETPDEPVVARTIDPPSAVVVAESLELPRETAWPTPAPDLPPLVIEIGRIDIRIASETATPAATPRRPAAGPVPSLEEYLARRGEAAP